MIYALCLLCIVFALIDRGQKETIKELRRELEDFIEREQKELEVRKELLQRLIKLREEELENNQ